MSASLATEVAKVISNGKAISLNSQSHEKKVQSIMQKLLEKIVSLEQQLVEKDSVAAIKDQEIATLKNAMKVTEKNKQNAVNVKITSVAAVPSVPKRAPISLKVSTVLATSSTRLPVVRAKQSSHTKDLVVPILASNVTSDPKMRMISSKCKVRLHAKMENLLGLPDNFILLNDVPGLVHHMKWPRDSSIYLHKSVINLNIIDWTEAEVEFRMKLRSLSVLDHPIMVAVD